MKKIVSSFLALMCLASVGMANEKLAAYKATVKNQVAKIMSSDKTTNEKIALLSEKAAKLEVKKQLNDKQKVALYEYYFALGKENYLTIKDFEKATTYFTKASALNNNSVVEYYKGNSLFYSKKYADAADAYRKVVLKGDLPKENDANLYWLKGCAEYHMREFGSAENDLKKAISLDGSKWEKGAYNVVVCLQKRGNYDEAISWLDRMCRNTNTLQLALRKKADIYCEMGRLDECEKAINDLESAFPTDDLLYVLKAQLSYARCDYYNVLAQLGQEFARPGRNSTYDYECYILYAQVALAEEKYDDAFAYVDKAVREPMPPYSMKLRGDIYLAMGNKAKALEQYNAFLRVSTSAPRSKYVTELAAKIQNELQEEAMRPENQ